MEEYRSIVEIADNTKGFINLRKFEQEQGEFKILSSGLQDVINRELRNKAKEQTKENLEKLYSSNIWKQLEILVKEEYDLERKLQIVFFRQKIQKRLSKIREEAYELTRKVPGVYDCSSAYSIRRALENNSTVDSVYISLDEVSARLLMLKNWKNKSFDELVKHLQLK